MDNKEEHLINEGSAKSMLSTSVNGKDSVEGEVLSSEKALSKTGGAEISFYYFQKYEEELRKKNDDFIKQLNSQREDFQQQLASERKDYLDRLDSQRYEFEIQLCKQREYVGNNLQKKEEAIEDLFKKNQTLSIANGFCRSLKWVNIIGAGITLLGTTGASVAASNKLYLLTAILSIIAVLGTLFPQIVTWLSESDNKVE